MIFETRRLYVTRWKSWDLTALHEFYDDSAMKDFIEAPLTMDETRSIFENQLNHYSANFPFGRYFIVEKASNNFIGVLLLKKDHTKRGIEIGYSFRKNDWNKGYATEIVKESIAWIFESTDFEFISAVTGQHNENSKNVLLKCGFLPEENFIEDGEEMNAFSLMKEDVLV